MYRKGRQVHALLCGKCRSWTSMVASQNGLKPDAWGLWVFLQVLGQDMLLLSLSQSSGWVAGVPGGWLESLGTRIQDPRPVTIPLPTERRGGGRGC